MRAPRMNPRDPFSPFVARGTAPFPLLCKMSTKGGALVKLPLAPLHRNGKTLKYIVIVCALTACVGMAIYNVVTACDDHVQQLVSAVPKETFDNFRNEKGTVAGSICLRDMSMPSAQARLPDCLAHFERPHSAASRLRGSCPPVCSVTCWYFRVCAELPGWCGGLPPSL